MGTVSKSDIIRDVAAHTGETATVTKAVIEAMLETVSQHADLGNTVNLMGFGRFVMKTSAARTGRNPATGAPVEIPESRKLTFKASKKSA